MAAHFDMNTLKCVALYLCRVFPRVSFVCATDTHFISTVAVDVWLCVCVCARDAKLLNMNWNACQLKLIIDVGGNFASGQSQPIVCPSIPIRYKSFIQQLQQVGANPNQGVSIWVEIAAALALSVGKWQFQCFMRNRLTILFAKFANGQMSYANLHVKWRAGKLIGSRGEHVAAHSVALITRTSARDDQ